MAGARPVDGSGVVDEPRRYLRSAVVVRFILLLETIPAAGRFGAVYQLCHFGHVVVADLIMTIIVHDFAKSGEPLVADYCTKVT